MRSAQLDELRRFSHQDDARQAPQHIFVRVLSNRHVTINLEGLGCEKEGNTDEERSTRGNWRYIWRRWSTSRDRGYARSQVIGIRELLGNSTERMRVQGVHEVERWLKKLGRRVPRKIRKDLTSPPSRVVPSESTATRALARRIYRGLRQRTIDMRHCSDCKAACGSCR